MARRLPLQTLFDRFEHGEVSGWLRTGKMVVYPIRKDLDSNGLQLINWVAEIETPTHSQRDWSRNGQLEDFIGAFENWAFDWHDHTSMLKASEFILEYPMVDQDPLPQWSFGRISLLGDAAHPMYPRGSNGAGQAILDARFLAGCLKRYPDPVATLKAYEEERLAAANKVVLMSRTNPPDAILREVDERSGGKPFESIEDVISKEELAAISERFKKVAGFEVNSLNARPSLVGDLGNLASSFDPIAREATIAKNAAGEGLLGTAEISAESGRSVFQRALRRISGFLNKQRDRDIERFINARGGMINDALDRELTRHCHNKGDD